MTSTKPAPAPTRRILRLTAGLLAWAALAVPAAAETYGQPPPPDAPVASREVRVQRQAGGFSIDVVMLAPVPPAVAWAVLTDFEHMPRYQSHLQRSEVLERSAERLLVRQQGVARLGPFSQRFESVREMLLAPPQRIRARQVSGGALRQMSSLMTLEPQGAGATRLTYHAEVEPEHGLPPLFGPAFVQHETAEQFSAMIREMARRQHAAR